MLNKVKNFFEDKSLHCSYCGHKIVEGDTFSVTMTMPSTNKMPVARLDSGLHKEASEIICASCK